MEGNDIQELIGNFSAMLQELKEKQDKIEGMLNDVMEGANNAYADWDHNKKKGEFSERNKDFLDKYSDKLKKIEGDDFDLAEEAMKGVGENDEAQYIAALAASIDEQLDALREALGASEVKAVDTEAEDKAEGDEKTEIEADGEKVAEVNEKKDDAEADAEEETTPPASESEGEVESSEASEEDSEEELEAFRKQIADEKKAMGR